MHNYFTFFLLIHFPAPLFLRLVGLDSALNPELVFVLASGLVASSVSSSSSLSKPPGHSFSYKAKTKIGPGGAHLRPN